MPTVPTEAELSNMTKADLEEAAKAENVSYPSKATKADIVSAILAARQGPGDETNEGDDPDPEETEPDDSGDDSDEEVTEAPNDASWVAPKAGYYIRPGIDDDATWLEEGEDFSVLGSDEDESEETEKEPAPPIELDEDADRGDSLLDNPKAVIGDWLEELGNEAKEKWGKLHGQLDDLEPKVVNALKGLDAKTRGFWSEAFSYIYTKREILEDKLESGTLTPRNFRKAMKANDRALDKYSKTVLPDTGNKVLKDSLAFGKDILSGIISIFTGS